MTGQRILGQNDSGIVIGTKMESDRLRKSELSPEERKFRGEAAGISRDPALRMVGLLVLLSGFGNAGPVARALAPTITAVTLTCTPASILTTQTSSCVPIVTGSGNFNSQVNLTASSGKLSATKVNSGTIVVFTPAVAGSAVITAVAAQDATKLARATVIATTPILAVNATSIAFGTVAQNTTVTQPLTLSSIGSAAVTVSAASISGAGFQYSGLAFPLTLSPSQMATLYIGFDPTRGGAFTGKLSLTSNSSTGSTTAVSLTGTGQSVPYQVNLVWNAPVSSPNPIAGYMVYRALYGTNSYLQLNAPITATSYVDGTVQNGKIYDYVVRSVDASGLASVASNSFTATIPQ